MACPSILLLISPDDLNTTWASLPENVLPLVPEEGLGGAWTELRGGIEIVRFGFPAASSNPWYQISRDPGQQHNALSLALERILWARQLRVLAIASSDLEATGRRAVSIQPSVVVDTRHPDETLSEFIARLRTPTAETVRG